MDSEEALALLLKIKMKFGCGRPCKTRTCRAALVQGWCNQNWNMDLWAELFSELLVYLRVLCGYV